LKKPTPKKPDRFDCHREVEENTSILHAREILERACRRLVKVKRRGAVWVRRVEDIRGAWMT